MGNNRLYLNMALFKQLEFADFCGVNKGAVSVYKKRGKVVMNAEGLFDTGDPVNQKFIEVCKKNAEKRGAAEKTEKMPGGTAPKFTGKTIKSTPKKPQNEAFSRENTKREKLAETLNEKFDAEMELKKKQSTKADAEARLLRMKEQKLMGELLPTILIKPLFQTHFQSLTVEFQHAINALITDVAVKTKLNRNVQAELRKKALNELNTSIDRAIYNTTKEIDKMINEHGYGQTKAA